MAAGERVCVTCRRPFTVTSEEMDALRRIADAAGWSTVRPPARCYDCRKRLREGPHVVPTDQPVTWYEDECRDCGQTFRIGPRDVTYYRDHGLCWPKRCRACRAANGRAPGTQTPVRVLGRAENTPLQCRR